MVLTFPFFLASTDLIFTKYALREIRRRVGRNRSSLAYQGSDSLQDSLRIRKIYRENETFVAVKKNTFQLNIKAFSMHILNVEKRTNKSNFYKFLLENISFLL